MADNRSIPDASVITELVYEDVESAADWLCSAFGFAKRLVIGDHRIQLTFGDGAIVVCDPRRDEQTGYEKAVADPSRGAAAALVRVQDADAHRERAEAAGAEILRPPTDFPYGERQYTARDPGGHVWTFSQSIADVDPAEWGGVLVEP